MKELLSFISDPKHVTEILEVTSSVWPGVRDDVLRIEQEGFPLSIRDEPHHLFELAHSPSGIFLVLRVVPFGNVVGYLAADVLENFKEIPGVDTDPHLALGDTIYLASVAIDTAWRRRGFGIAIQKECIRRASKKGFKRLTAHIYHNALERTRMDGRVIQSFDNWYGTNQMFDYVEISTAQGG